MNISVNDKIRWPEFFIIGAAKSGTSSVHQYLCRHPQIYMPTLKEPEYYSDDSVYSRGNEWYTNLFARAKRDQICGEGSTTYSRSPHTPAVPFRMHQDVPNAKLIYIMRHPVARTYSHYCHHMREGVTMTFEEALERDSIYVDCSKYIEQIKKYLKYFRDDSFLFLFMDDLKSSPHDFLNDIQLFLGLETQDLTRQGLVYNNVSGVDHFLRRHTTEKLRKIPLVNFVADNTPQQIRDLTYQLIKKSPFSRTLIDQFEFPKMKTSTRDNLLEMFYPYNKQLEEYLGKKLPAWESYDIKPKYLK